MSKWIKKIKREFKRSPGKAAVLGGLAVVAVAFWGYRLAAAPRSVSQQASVSGMGQAETETDGPVFPTQEGSIVASSEEAKVDLTPWHVLQAWRAQPFQAETASAQLGRDPFVMKSPPVHQSAEESLGKSDVDDVSPATLGLRFTGVVIAGDWRAAILENRLLWEGSAFKVHRNGRSYVVRICEVTPTAIKLTIDGAVFEQSLPELGLSPKGSEAP